MDLQILCDYDEEVNATKNGRGAESSKNTETGLSESVQVREKKFSRAERHTPDEDIIDQCEWEKFPPVINSRRIRNRKNGMSRDAARRPDAEMSPVKMAIIASEYPNVLINTDIMWTIQSYIFGTLTQTPEPYAKIGVGNVINGALRVTCLGLKAVDWLKGLEGISMEGITLKVVSVDDLPSFPLERQQYERREQGVKRYKMAITSENHPNIPIEQRIVPTIRSVISEKLNETPEPKPVINITDLMGGALHIICEGTNSDNWLRELNGQPVGSNILKVVHIKDLPKPVKMSWTTKKHLTDTPKMLGYLQRWNKKLRTNEWKIIYTHIFGYYLRRVIIMDAVSANIIKAANYNLYAGVEFTRFRLERIESRNYRY